jgi:hypothetical protein
MSLFRVSGWLQKNKAWLSRSDSTVSDFRTPANADSLLPAATTRFTWLRRSWLALVFSLHYTRRNKVKQNENF